MNRIIPIFWGAVLAAGLTPLFSAGAQETVLWEQPETEFVTMGQEVWSTDLPGFYVEVDALWLMRDRPDRRSLAVRASQQDGTVLATLNTNAFDFEFGPGLRVLVGRPLDEVHSIEVLYYGLNNWFDRKALTINTDSNLDERITSPYLALAIVNGSQQFAYDSMFNNVELNLRREVDAGEYRTFSWLMGFRYLSLNESFAAVNEQALLVDPFGQITGMVADERGGAQTYNNLVGLQLGAELTETFGPMILGVHGTAGAYANFAKARYAHRYLIDGGFDSFDSAGASSRTNTDVSGVFTLGFDSVFRITSGISIRFAYEFLVATGLALAPDQAQPVTVQFDAAANQFVTTFAPGGGFDQDGLLFLHGPSIGFLFVW